MDEVNQLVLDCIAKVLRINQTTAADLFFGFSGHVNAVSCYGHRKGYFNSQKDKDGYPIRDYEPIDDWEIWLDTKDTVSNLRGLLESLNDLEKELLSDAG